MRERERETLIEIEKLARGRRLIVLGNRRCEPSYKSLPSISVCPFTLMPFGKS